MSKASHGRLLGICRCSAGSITTIIFQWFLPWWREPKLIIDRGVPGLVVNTPDTDSPTTVDRYARVRVSNGGRNRRERRALLDRAHRVLSSRRGRANERRRGPRSPMGFVHDIMCDIPAGSHRFAELCHVSQREGGPVVLKIGARDVPLRFASLLGAAGMFEFHVIATAENAGTVPAIIRIRWTGTLEGLDIESASPAIADKSSVKASGIMWRAPDGTAPPYSRNWHNARRRVVRLFLRAGYRIEPRHVQRDALRDGYVGLNLHGRTREVDRGCRESGCALEGTCRQVGIGVRGHMVRG